MSEQNTPDVEEELPIPPVEYENDNKSNDWPYLVIERRPGTREECTLLKKTDEEDFPLLPYHRVAARGSKGWCENWIEKKSKSWLSHRQYLSYLHRARALRHQIIDSPRQNPHYTDSLIDTPDEKEFPQFAASFHKLLEHDPLTGLLTKTVGKGGGGNNLSGVQNYEQLKDGLQGSALNSDFDTDALNGLHLLNREPVGPDGKKLSPRVLINPRSSKALSLSGPDIAALDVSEILYGTSNIDQLLKQISLGSDATAAEIVEVYAMALLRNVALGEYNSKSDDARLAVEALRSFGNSFGQIFKTGWKYAAGQPLTLQNLFRGPTEGDMKGNYLSVFLTFKRPPLFPSGCAPHVANLTGASKFAKLLSTPLLVPQGGNEEFGTTWDDYVKIQNAEIPKVYPDGHFTGLDLLKTGRNLGDYVHVDNVYEQYIRAADILIGHQYNRSLNFPYTDEDKLPYYENEGDGPTMGPSDVYGLIGGVRIIAERASFTQKWLVARRARPEVMAALIDRAFNGNNELKAVLSERLFKEAAVLRLLERVNRSNGDHPEGKGGKNFLLSQMYPEGSPAHPSWTSGHATVAGACVTVLKAIFEDRNLIIDPESPPNDPQHYVAPDNSTSTVAEELDKLASNISFGRNFGGVHYRSDGEHGILLGEEVAIRYLQDYARTYREQFRECAGYTLTKRNGDRICVTPDSVTEIDHIDKDMADKLKTYPKSNL